jgi:hypothetical protein
MSQASVVIASRRPALIANTIVPLLEDPATLEVVIVAVDNPAVAAAVRATGDPRVQVVAAPAGNPNTARQIGVERARGETVVMLDDDVCAGPGLVGGHARHHPTPGLVVFGYMPIPPDRLRGVRSFPSRLYARNYESRVRWWTEQPELVLTGFWGGNVSMTRTDLLRIGLENPAFPVRYFEDYEFGDRCHADGMVGIFDRGLEAAHFYERSISEWLVEGRRIGAARAILQPGVEPGPGHLPPALRPALIAGTLAAATLRLRRLEDRLAWAARQIEIFRGGEKVAAGTAVADGLLVGWPPQVVAEGSAPPGSDHGGPGTSVAGFCAGDRRALR